SALMLVMLALGLAANNFMIRHEQKRTQEANLRLKDNLDLSLKTLDEDLKAAEDRFPRQDIVAKEEEGQLGKALRFYENFAQRNQDDPNVRREVANAYYRAGVIHTRVGHFEEANVALDRATGICARLIEDFPADQEPKLLLAQVHLQKGISSHDQGDF